MGPTDGFHGGSQDRANNEEHLMNDGITAHSAAWRVAYCQARVIRDWAEDVAAATREEAEAEAIVRGLYRIAEFDGLEVAVLYSPPPCCSPPPPASTRPYRADDHCGPRSFDIVVQDGRLAHRSIRTGDTLWIDPDQRAQRKDVALVRVFDADDGTEMEQISPGLCEFGYAADRFADLTGERAAFIESIGRAAFIESRFVLVDWTDELWPIVQDQLLELLEHSGNHPQDETTAEEN